MTTGYDLLMSARWLLDGPEYDPDTGVVEPDAMDAWAARLAAWAEAADDKLVAYRVVRERLRAEVALHKAEAAKHSRRAAALGGQCARLETLATELMELRAEATGETRAALSDGRKAWLHPTTSVVVDEVDWLPGAYVVTVTTTRPDKAAIKKALGRDEDVPGAWLSTSRRIRWS